MQALHEAPTNARPARRFRAEDAFYPDPAWVRRGLAVEGPGFRVWDEVASDARRRAEELSAVVAGSRTSQR